MLGRKFLKRFTRLGLSAYLTFWCMSFTVCAAENPLADLAVQGLDQAVIQTDSSEGEEADAEVEPDNQDDLADADVVDEEKVTDADDPQKPDVHEADEDADDAALEETADDKEDPSEDVLSGDDTDTAEGITDPVTEDAADADIDEEDIQLSDDSVLSDDETDPDGTIKENAEDVEAVDDELLGMADDVDEQEWIDSISLNQHEALITSKENRIISIRVGSYLPSDHFLNNSRIKWSFYYANGTLIPDDILDYSTSYSSCYFDCSKLPGSMVFYIQAEYKNTYGLSTDAVNPKDQCRVQYVAPGDDEEQGVEFELSQKSMDVELFRQYNNLSFLVKADYEDTGSDEGLLGGYYNGAKYIITKVEFEEEELNEYFKLDVMDGDRINVNLTDDMRENYNASEINSRLNKKSYSSRIKFTYIKTDESMATYTTEDKLTLNIKRSYPTAKIGKITINPYLAGSQYIVPSMEGYGIDRDR